MIEPNVSSGPTIQLAGVIVTRMPALASIEIFEKDRVIEKLGPKIGLFTEESGSKTLEVGLKIFHS